MGFAVSTRRHVLSRKLFGARVSLTPIASGAMGYVYRVDCADVMEPLTFKILRGSHRNNPVLRAAMAREFALLKALGRGQIPQVKDHMQWRGRTIVSYRFIDGESLLSALARGAIDQSAALDFGIALMDILRQLHSHELAIVHGDVSPENLLIDKNGQLHLIDFGGACSTTLEHAPCMPGKPSYMSPEQAQGRPWTARSDLYQAGIVLFEMLTGKRFNPESSPITRRAFSANPEVDLDEFLDVPLRATLRRLLDVDAAARWPTAQACKVALLRLRDEYNGVLAS